MKKYRRLIWARLEEAQNLRVEVLQLIMRNNKKWLLLLIIAATKTSFALGW